MRDVRILILNKILSVNLVLVIIHFAYGEWVEISQTLSRPPHSQTLTTPTYYDKTHGTIATKKTKIKNLSNSTEKFNFNTAESLSHTIMAENQSEYQDQVSSGKFTEAKNELERRADADKLFLQRELDNVFLEGEGTNDQYDDDSYGGFLPYLQSIQSSLMKNTHRNVKSKVSLLQKLRDNLLVNIKEKITYLWNPHTKSRQARDYHETNDSHMDFPSHEGALMTIGFLTFAVFLIKLVLKLIHSLKNKNNGNGTMTPVIMTSVGRKRRDVFNEEAVRILHLMEEYKFQ